MKAKDRIALVHKLPSKYLQSLSGEGIFELCDYAEKYEKKKVAKRKSAKAARKKNRKK